MKDDAQKPKKRKPFGWLKIAHSYGRFPTSPNQRGRGKVRTELDAANDALADKDLYLHPTKGFRKIKGKRSRVGLITAERKQGVRYSTAQIKSILDNSAL